MFMLIRLLMMPRLTSWRQIFGRTSARSLETQKIFELVSEVVVAEQHRLAALVVPVDSFARTEGMVMRRPREHPRSTEPWLYCPTTASAR